MLSYRPAIHGGQSIDSAGVPDRRASSSSSCFQLNSPRLPPLPPQSLEIRADQQQQPQSGGLEISHALGLGVARGGAGAVGGAGGAGGAGGGGGGPPEEHISWHHICSQAPSPPSTIISHEGLEATSVSSPASSASSIAYRRSHFRPSLVLLSSSSPSPDYSSSEPDPYHPALMAPSGLETPPGSARSSCTELDRQPHSYTHSATSVPGEYLPPNNSNAANSSHVYPLAHHHGHGQGHGRGGSAPRESPYLSFQSPNTHHSPGHGSPDPRYIYTPYGVESRPQPQLPLPLPYDNRNDMPSLPWPNPTAAAAAASRRYPEPIPSISLNPSHEPWADRSIGHYPPSHASDSEYRCSSARCRFTASSQEHLTRHQQKHMKIHYCRFTPCPRTEGFATPNDRERHEKSIHKIPGCYWKCLDNNCGSYGKEFSRRDNLKDHLKRMHPVPEGMNENEASALRSRLADTWRFDKGSHDEAAAIARHRS